MPRVYAEHMDVIALEREFQALWEAVDGILKRESRLRNETGSVAGAADGNIAGSTPTTGRSASYGFRFLAMGT